VNTAPRPHPGPGAPKHAVITGASSGIGRAVVTRLLGEGWRVTGLSRTEPREDSERFRWSHADLTDLDALGAVLDPIADVDAIVHAAGLQRSAPLGQLSPADGAAMWRVHVEAASYLVNALLPVMHPGGRIVLIGSRTAAGAAGKSQYAASKAALVGMSRSWAMELAPRAITVNVVAPGPTDTPMLRDPARRSTPPQQPPLGRFVRPDEVAGLTAFLLGPDAALITGQQLVMCGGVSL
jgi:NAD(P)-dependent dehydrogenase (short-subunit alcohol dehydrogenase family)